MKLIKINKEPTNYFHLILLIIAGVAILAMIYISYILTMIAIDETNTLQSVFQRKAIMSLVSDKGDYNFGDIVKISVVLSTENRKTPGVDVLLAYDPEFLQALSLSGAKLTGKGIVKFKSEQILDVSNSKFDTFPYFSIDYNKSLLLFEALTQPLKNFQGIGEIGSLNFKALKSGKTQIKLVFQKGSAIDSNIAFAGRDVLTSVNNVEINIK